MTEKDGFLPFSFWTVSAWKRTSLAGPHARSQRFTKPMSAATALSRSGSRSFRSL
ncbi:hypothetical protein AOPFMNJM_1422 [Methylobacterium jeotgali]|uniref:Uncharacterized protein n=1 Tax=Methylobacterium jeotgali TaxID=381630 RepID=A0ABQ4SSF0_9HYPH|nr:hypothetical protein AOPFMNJM_1422 [Methylobacterium jeotgali]